MNELHNRRWNQPQQCRVDSAVASRPSVDYRVLQTSYTARFLYAQRRRKFKRKLVPYHRTARCKTMFVIQIVKASIYCSRCQVYWPVTLVCLKFRSTCMYRCNVGKPRRSCPGSACLDTGLASGQTRCGGQASRRHARLAKRVDPRGDSFVVWHVV